MEGGVKRCYLLEGEDFGLNGTKISEQNGNQLVKKKGERETVDKKLEESEWMVTDN